MNRIHSIALSAALVALSLLAAGCDRADTLERVQERGKLRVLTRNSPTTWYRDRGAPSGFEYSLASELAKRLGVELEMRPVFSLQALFTALERGEADILAAGLTLTGTRELRFPHSASYLAQYPQVVYVAGTRRPRHLRDIGPLEPVVLAGSSHATALAALRDGGMPELRWREVDGADSMALLEMVEAGQAALAIVDSHEFEVLQGLFPRLKVAFDLGDEQQTVWYLSPGADNQRLLDEINGYFAELNENGKLQHLRERHFGHSRGVSRVGSFTFSRKMRSKLPRYRTLIEQVAREYQMDWQLLAAMAYQESHWDPQATSPTGVRGMMMLTRPTARELGVSDRLDPLQSLRGGARYYKDLKRRLSPEIAEPDRSWMALAAYNVGLGHVRDARQLVSARGGDPDLWSEVADALPLLQKSRYYRDTAYGYARGGEAVTYVQNIRHYYSILQWQELPGQQPTAPLQVDDYLPGKARALRLEAL